MRSQEDSLTQGILYFAKGEDFISEATLSAKRVKQLTDYHITLVSDRSVEADCFDRVEIDSKPFEKADKPRVLSRSPYDRTLFLDTDTFVDGPINGLFDILEEYDLAVCQNRDEGEIPDNPSPTAPNTDIPDTYPEFNTGVIAYRDNSRVRTLFDRWESLCESDHKYDQRSFRPALYRSDVQFTSITSRYNCQFNYNNRVSGQVRIFHGALVDRATEGVPIGRALAALRGSDGFRLHYRYYDRLYINTVPGPIEKNLVIGRVLWSIYRTDGLRGVVESILSDLLEREEDERVSLD